uniref:Uncharacterized protein n=1 Tax=Arundo donax TaxID=35708 RepID=A0A0A9HBZ4_ARUDO
MLPYSGELKKIEFNLQVVNMAKILAKHSSCSLILSIKVAPLFFVLSYCEWINIQTKTLCAFTWTNELIHFSKIVSIGTIG